MESPEFPYQASSQPWVWHVLAGAVAESEMALPQFPHSPAGARAWFNPAQPHSQLSCRSLPKPSPLQPSCELVGVVVQPGLACHLSWLSLMPVPILAVTNGSYSLAQPCPHPF